MKHYEDDILPRPQPGWGRVMIVVALIGVLVAMFLLSGCATKTAPEFLQNASASMWGGAFTAPNGARSLMAAPAPKPNGFATFYGGGGQ